MRKIFLIIVFAMLLCGCQIANPNYVPTNSVIVDTCSDSYEEQNTELDSSIRLNNWDEQGDECFSDSEMAAFIRNIVSTDPLKQSEDDLNYYTEKYVLFGHFRSFISRSEHWEHPNQIDMQSLLYAFEHYEFNNWYVRQYAQMNPNVNLWSSNELVELIVDEQIVESFITDFVDIDIERLRQSDMYNAELRGYRFRVLDGLGSGIIHPYARTVWRSDSFIVIEVRDSGMDAIMSAAEAYIAYILIEVFDEIRFMYRAYIRLP